MNSWIVIGSILAGLSVAAGAFAAHKLDPVFAEKYAGETVTYAGREMPRSERYLQVFMTGAEYQMSHSLALIAVGILVERKKSALLKAAGMSFLLGILLFSGSLYVLTTTGVTKWGMVTPIGGVMFLAGWTLLTIAAARPSTLDPQP